MNKKEEIEQFLATVVKGCYKYITEEKSFSFDIQFEIDGKKYRLTMAHEEKDNSYLKDN